MSEQVNVKLSKSEKMQIDDITIYKALERQQEIYRRAIKAKDGSPFNLTEFIGDRHDKERLKYLDKAFGVEQGLREKRSRSSESSYDIVVEAINTCSEIVELALKQIDANLNDGYDREKDLNTVFCEKTISSFNISELMSLFEKKNSNISRLYMELSPEEKEKIDKMRKSKGILGVPASKKDIIELINRKLRERVLHSGNAGKFIKEGPNFLRICTKYMDDEEIASLYPLFLENRERFWTSYINSNKLTPLDIDAIRKLNVEHENLGLEYGGGLYQQFNEQCMIRRIKAEHSDLQYKFILAIADARTRTNQSKLNSDEICMKYFDEELLEGAKKSLEIVLPSNIAKKDKLFGLNNSDVKGNFFINLIRRIFGAQER